MKELIDLLNSFCREKRGDYVVTKYREKEHSFDTFVEGKVDYMTDLYVVSKRCGFIEWLVENDKIDYEKSPGEIMFDDRMGTTFSLEDSIVMMLSISDNPIQDLCEFIQEDDEDFDKAEVVEEFFRADDDVVINMR